MARGSNLSRLYTTHMKHKYNNNSENLVSSSCCFPFKITEWRRRCGRQRKWIHTFNSTSRAAISRFPLHLSPATAQGQVIFRFQNSVKEMSNLTQVETCRRDANEILMSRPSVKTVCRPHKNGQPETIIVGFELKIFFNFF